MKTVLANIFSETLFRIFGGFRRIDLPFFWAKSTSSPRPNCCCSLGFAQKVNNVLGTNYVACCGFARAPTKAREPYETAVLYRLYKRCTVGKLGIILRYIRFSLQGLAPNRSKNSSTGNRNEPPRRIHRSTEPHSRISNCQNRTELHRTIYHSTDPHRRTYNIGKPHRIAP